MVRELLRESEAIRDPMQESAHEIWRSTRIQNTDP
jgi:hypothetical protein